MKAKQFLDHQAEQQLLEAIREAEKLTSGEIRVHIENHCKRDAVQAASSVFRKLKMHQTEHHNGVLFYLALMDKKFAVYADEGLYQRVPTDFWHDIVNEMALNFAKGNFLEGLCHGIKQAGEALASHFPRLSDDRNELDDSISMGKH